VFGFLVIVEISLLLNVSARSAGDDVDIQQTTLYCQALFYGRWKKLVTTVHEASDGAGATTTAASFV
jgi:hypothetical protein